MVDSNTANYTVCEDTILKSVARWGEWWGHPGQHSPRDRKVNILN